MIALLLAGVVIAVIVQAVVLYRTCGMDKLIGESDD